MRRVFLVAVLGGCWTASPSPAPTAAPAAAPEPAPKPAPSAECVSYANGIVDQMVGQVTMSPEYTWQYVHGKPEFGQPATLDEEDFTRFLGSPDSRAWICGIQRFCSSYYKHALNHCEKERVKAEPPPSP